MSRRKEEGESKRNVIKKVHNKERGYKKEMKEDRGGDKQTER